MSAFDPKRTSHQAIRHQNGNDDTNVHGPISSHRKRRETGKCEGRKSHAEKRPGAVALAKKLHRANPKTGKRMSLRRISAALAETGHLNEHGRPFNQRSIKVMVEG